MILMDATNLTIIIIFIILVIVAAGFYIYERGLINFNHPVDGGEQPPLPPGFEGSESEEEQPPAFPG